MATSVPSAPASTSTSGPFLASDEDLAVAERIKRQANGMLGARVYCALMDLARSSRPRTIVEIGTAHGAAAIALALGVRASGSPCHIYTVDPFAGFSSRVKFGSVAENQRIVKEAFAHFGVTDCVTVVVGTSADVLPHLPRSAIDLLLIDADGRIDRDLAVLFDHLADEASIVIDDVDGATCLTRFQDRVYCDQKHRLSRLLVDRLLASRHLKEECVVESTGFYRKGSGAAATIEAQALPAYRELVFVDIDAIAAPKCALPSGSWPPGFRSLMTAIGRRLRALTSSR